jgi:EXLDI family protein
MENEVESTPLWRRFTVTRDGDLDLTFKGARLASATSHTHNNNGRWTEIDIYRTRAGMYVVWVVERTQWEREADRHTAHVCDTGSAVIEAITQDGWLSDLAKEVLALADIETAERIE